VLKYGGKLMQCLEELNSKHEYMERSGRGDKYRDIERRGQKRRHYEDDDEFVRYY
jgi:hypothetical protein